MSITISEATLQNPVAFLSSLCDGLSAEERKKRLVTTLNELDSNVVDAKRSVVRTKDDIEAVRTKYENMNDLVKTLEQLKCSLEEHIRTVRLNESSFGGTSAVLEYDSAKTRTKTLIEVIKARNQLDRAKEILAEGADDQQKLYECLLDIQQSQATLNKFVPGVTEDKSLEGLKDRYLAWQSTALIFAIQQADYDKLFEIQKTYEMLDRRDEFTSVFRRISINRIKEFALDVSSVQTIFDGLYKELDFVYTRHLKVLRRFLTEDESSSLLLDAIKEGVDCVELSSPLANLVHETADPVELLKKIDTVFANYSDETSPLSQILLTRMRHELALPFSSALTTFALSKVNTLELTTGSFRSKVESLKTSITELIQLIHDMFTQSYGIFSDNVQKVVQQAIDKALENFMAKLKSWNYKTDGQGRQRSLDDLMSVCSASGQLVYGLEELKSLIEEIDASLSVNVRSIAKWNRQVVDSVLRATCEPITSKISTKIQAIVSAPADEPVSLLPSYGTTPSEYVTSAGQELLQVFHRWEQFFLDDNIAHAFYVSFKRKYEGDELFKKTMADVANRVIHDYAEAIDRVTNLTPQIVNQLLADTVFLKDAFDDLRTGNTEMLVKLEEKLNKRQSS